MKSKGIQPGFGGRTIRVDQPEADDTKAPVAVPARQAFRADTVEARRRELAVSYGAQLEMTHKATFRVTQPSKVGVLCLGGQGGSGNVARTCAAALADAGHETHLLSSQDSFFAHGRKSKVRAAGMNVPLSPKAPDQEWVAPLTEQIVEYVRKHDLEVINVHYTTGLLEAAIGAKEALAKEGRQLSVAATLHGSDVSVWGQREDYGPVLAAQLAKCDDISCVSNHLAYQAQEVFGLTDLPRVIENSIDAYRFSPGQWTNIRPRVAPNGEVVFCHISNMREIKRPLDAVETFAKVRSAGVAAKLLLVGDGPMLEQMHDRAVELGVQDDILCTGPVPPDKLAKYVASSDIVLITSASESFSLAALESMACGTPVVGTRCGGLDEVMSTVDAGSEGSRLLSDVGDVAGMAATCYDLITNPQRYHRVQRESIQVPLDKYPQDRQAQGYLTMLDDVRKTGAVVNDKATSTPMPTGSRFDVQVQELGRAVSAKRRRKK